MEYVMYTKYGHKFHLVEITEDLDKCQKWYKEGEHNFYCTVEDYGKMI